MALPHHPPEVVGGAQEAASPVPGREQAHLTRSLAHTFIQQTSNLHSEPESVRDAGSHTKSRELQRLLLHWLSQGAAGAVSVGLRDKARVRGEV